MLFASCMGVVWVNSGNIRWIFMKFKKQFRGDGRAHFSWVLFSGSTIVDLIEAYLAGGEGDNEGMADEGDLMESSSYHLQEFELEKVQ